MITFLEIENILLIKKAEIDFKSGLCVLTGETGAGKSIILNSILFLIGKKIKYDSKDILRKGVEKGSISGCFDISSNSSLKAFLLEKGFGIEEELVIKRVLAYGQKERSFINGSIVSTILLSEIGNFLIDVNRQNEQVGLFEKSNHLKILDLYGGLGSELSLVENAFNELLKIRQEIKETTTLLEKWRHEREYLEVLVGEIEALKVEMDEERLLMDKKLEINKTLKGIQAVNDILQKLFYEKNIRSSFVFALKAATDKTEIEEGILETVIGRILNDIDLLEEILVNHSKSNQFTEYDLDQVNERLFLIRDVARKYKVRPDELPAFLENQRVLLNRINLSDERLCSLAKKEIELKEKYNKYAFALSEKRKLAAIRIEERINSELQDLEMQGAIFKVLFKETAVKVSITGDDSIEFLVSTNRGMPPASLVKVASGGELSRILLAIKIVLLKVNMRQTVIFDEIDAGIGGKTSIVVALKLKDLAKAVQVILITHQASIAAKGSFHLHIYKNIENDIAETKIQVLSLEERVKEIARMLSGEISSESLETAKKMLQ